MDLMRASTESPSTSPSSRGPPTAREIAPTAGGGGVRGTVRPAQSPERGARGERCGRSQRGAGGEPAAILQRERLAAAAPAGATEQERKDEELADEGVRRARWLQRHRSRARSARWQPPLIRFRSGTKGTAMTIHMQNAVGTSRRGGGVQ